jgi:hypothetical protein
VPAHGTIADSKENLQGDDPDIAGFGNDHEPAPLFARTYMLNSPTVLSVGTHLLS